MGANINRHRISAVSSIIRQLEAESEIKAKASIELKFVVANNLFHRLNAFRLGYNEYLKKGYIHENQIGLLMNDLDLEEETLTIVAYLGMYEAGTVTINTQKVLPFQSLFSSDLVNSPNFKLAELTRLAINENYRNQKEILLGMFNYVFTYTKFIKNCTHLAIEVNPRHVKFYDGILGFTPIAENTSCPRVCGAPAVLLIGDLNLPMTYPENYSFISQGKEQEKLINNFKNVNSLTPRELEILQEALNQIKNTSQSDSQSH